MTQQNFDIALAKGNLGELIVKNILEGQNWTVYQPMTKGAHYFDMLGILKKERAIALDIKAKSRMTKYPCTGVNQRHFEEYKAFSEKHLMPFWIVFVDEHLKKIYGNTLEQLEKPRTIGGCSYPWLMKTPGQKPIRLWPLAAMKRIANIPDTAAAELANMSQRNYEY